MQKMLIDSNLRNVRTYQQRVNNGKPGIKLYKPAYYLIDLWK